MERPRVPSWQAVVNDKRAGRDIALRPYLPTASSATKKHSIIIDIEDIEVLVEKLRDGELKAIEVIEAYVARLEY